jgi:hypothetical protein
VVPCLENTFVLFTYSLNWVNFHFTASTVNTAWESKRCYYVSPRKFFQIKVSSIIPTETHIQILFITAIWWGDCKNSYQNLPKPFWPVKNPMELADGNTLSTWGGKGAYWLCCQCNKMQCLETGFRACPHWYCQQQLTSILVSCQWNKFYVMSLIPPNKSTSDSLWKGVKCMKLSWMYEIYGETKEQESEHYRRHALDCLSR